MKKELILNRFLALTLIVFLSNHLLIAQQQSKFPVVDSLQKLADRSNGLIYDYKIKQSLELAMKLANYAHELYNDYYKAEAYNLMGSNYSLLIDHKSAEENFKKSLEYAKS